MTTTTSTFTDQTHACDRESRITKSLLGYGVIVGPAYVAVALAQALTRPGFDLSRHPWSMLANGEHGWVQVANLVVAGLMTIAFSVGLRRSLTPGVGSGWGPRLVAVFGASLVAAGVFRADPALGFPAGTPEGPGEVSWHGLFHFAAGGVGFTCLAIACFVVARRYSAEGRRGWAAISRVVGVVFLTGFAAMASGAAGAAGILSFTGAVVLVWVWVSAVSVDRYRRADQPSLTAATR
jgi:hypothetical membrane protein